jgi:hypothetical protein
MKNYIYILIISVLFFASCSDDNKIEQEISSTEPVIQSQPAITITSKQLYQEYNDNEVAADLKYKEKILLVNGTVDNIAKDITDNIYVTLSGNEFIGDVQCFFSEAHTNEAAQLKKGMKITIKGKCDGKMMNILLRGCSIVENIATIPKPSVSFKISNENYSFKEREVYDNGKTYFDTVFVFDASLINNSNKNIVYTEAEGTLQLTLNDNSVIEIQNEKNYKEPERIGGFATGDISNGIPWKPNSKRSLMLRTNSILPTKGIKEIKYKIELRGTDETNYDFTELIKEYDVLTKWKHVR